MNLSKLLSKFKRDKKSTLLLLHDDIILSFKFTSQRLDNGDYCARLREMGLTAYGKTEKEAAVKLYKMVKYMLDVKKKEQLLESYLNRTSLEWHNIGS